MKLTKFKIKLVTRAIKECGTCDMDTLTLNISEYLVDRYPDCKLDFELERLGLSTVKNIKELIRTYFERFPRRYFK